MNPDAVKTANEVASLAYTLIGIVAVLLVLFVGAVKLWFEHGHVMRKLKWLEGKVSDAETTHTEMGEDLNQASQSWEFKLLEFRREIERQRLDQAILCGKHTSEVEVLKSQAKQTLDILTNIQQDIHGLRNQFIDMIKEKKPGR